MKNDEWLNYTLRTPLGLEVIPTTLYDTRFYLAQDTTRLQFFNDVNNKHRSHTNMQVSGMLPNPKAFLIESIRINGINSNLQFGACTLYIGAKHYGVNPAWAYSMKQKGFNVRPNLMIAPLMHFYFEIVWETPNKIGQGPFGFERRVQIIQVVLFGQEARAIQ